MKARLSILIVTLLLILPSRVSGIGPDTIFSDLQKIMERVADWQINNFTYQKTGNLHDYGIDAWTNAVLYAGMLKWVQTTEVPSTYLDWLMKIGEENEWSVPANFADYPKYQYYHADELCIGQFYLGMYDRYKKDAMFHAVQERVDWIMNHPADTSMRYSNKQCWTWCDALFMAPPVYVHLARITGKTSYLEFMHTHFCKLIIICMTGLTICSFVTTVILVNKKRMAQKSFGAEEMDGFWQELPIYSNYYPKTRVCDLFMCNCL